MTKTKKSIIFWVLATSAMFGTIFGPIYFNFWAEQRIKEAVIAPIYKEGAITKAKTMRMEELAKSEAQQKATEWKRKLMNQYNLLFIFSGSTDEKVIKTFNRIQQNKKLAEALQYAKEQGIWVFFTDSHRFGVRSNSVDIPIQATDEEVITFLLGSSAKNKASQ